MSTLRFYATSIAFFGTAMWLSDYQYDWALLLAGTLYGQLAPYSWESTSDPTSYAITRKEDTE